MMPDAGMHLSDESNALRTSQRSTFLRTKEGMSRQLGQSPQNQRWPPSIFRQASRMSALFRQADIDNVTKRLD
jgi:mevalonate pyrophosphate decarboxylase